MKPIATPSRTKEILEMFDVFAKKNYGQNFLTEPGVVDKIARSAVISDHTLAVEIGPGIGALTQYLCEYAEKVIAFEIDERLPEVLSYTLQDYTNVEVILKDFLKTDISALVNDYRKDGYDVAVCANLPYYITTPILFKLFESKADITNITVMMQKEVADRFLAQVNTKDYNALSVITQYLCHVKLIMKVPKQVFQPKPKVDSAVLQFTFRKDERLKEEAEFFEMVKACFKQRRKTILNNYGEYITNKVQAQMLLEKAGILLNERAEHLNEQTFLRLFAVQQLWKEGSLS